MLVEVVEMVSVFVPEAGVRVCYTWRGLTRVIGRWIVGEVVNGG